VIENDRHFARPNSNNNGMISNKKKEYLELIKLLSSGNEPSANNRNKPKVQEQRTNSKGKTFEVSINLDQNDKRVLSGRKSNANNTSSVNSKSNSLTKNTTNSSVKKVSSNKTFLPPELSKLQSMKLDNRNTKKSLTSGVPVNNCPQTSKNPQKKNLVSDMMNQQKKINNNKKISDKVFINLNSSNNNTNLQKKLSDLEGNNLKKEESGSTKHTTNTTILNLDRKCESYQNQIENRSLFKNENSVVSYTKHKSDFVKVINNFSNYTKIKKDSAIKGKENVNFTNDSSYENKKQVTALQIRNSGGDEDSVIVDEN